MNYRITTIELSKYHSVRKRDIDRTQLHSHNDRPALVFNQNRGWFKNGKLHRLKGPAIIYNSDKVEYYIEGENLTYEEWANYDEVKI